MEKLNRRISPDRELVKKALIKAKNMNVALNATQLLNFMLARVAVDGEFLVINPKNLEWVEGDQTTSYFNNEHYIAVANHLGELGHRNDYSFVYNLLMWNFLHYYGEADNG